MTIAQSFGYVEWQFFCLNNVFCSQFWYGQKKLGVQNSFGAKKCILKSALFRIFHQFLRFTSNDHSSVICWGRTILSTSFENLGQRAIQILFWILSNIFGRCQKIDFKNVLLANFLPVTSDWWHRWGWLHSITLYYTQLYCNV